MISAWRAGRRASFRWQDQVGKASTAALCCSERSAVLDRGASAFEPFAIRDRTICVRGQAVPTYGTFAPLSINKPRNQEFAALITRHGDAALHRLCCAERVQQSRRRTPFSPDINFCFARSPQAWPIAIQPSRGAVSSNGRRRHHRRGARRLRIRVPMRCRKDGWPRRLHSRSRHKARRHPRVGTTGPAARPRGSSIMPIPDRVGWEHFPRAA